MTRLLFYDNVDTGHHPGFVNGIVDSAQSNGIEFLVATPSPPPSLLNAASWIEVASCPLRNIRGNRNALRTALNVGRGQIDALVDLYYDKNAWVTGTARDLPSIHVLHHGDQYDLAGRSIAGRARTYTLRLLLKQRTKAGQALLVHTERTRAIVDPHAVDGSVSLAGYPVIALPATRPRTSNSRPILLFVGAGRHEKGLDILLEAFEGHSDRADLRIVGRQPPGFRESLGTGPTNVTWIDEYVDTATLHSEYHLADLAVLPYRRVFGDHGGPSSVLLETISAGVPVVTTTALADQLPPGYEGAVVCEPDDVQSLRQAIVGALDDLEVMASAASEEGPRHIETNHSFTSYVRALLAAVEGRL